MDAKTAADLINSMVYKPEWTFEASPHGKRFENSIRIHVTYAARNSDKEDAPDYPNWIENGARADFVLMVGGDDELSLLRKLISHVIMPIEEHEAREFLRYPVAPYVAPFHPHNLETMQRWGNPTADLNFGLG